MLYLDYDSVISAMQEAVTEKGEDYIYANSNGDSSLSEDGSPTYARCYYVHGDTPGCIVGNVLNRLGIPLHELRAREHGSVSDVLCDMETEGIVNYDYRARSALIEAQGAQDTGKTWQTALLSAMNA